MVAALACATGPQAAGLIDRMPWRCPSDKYRLLMGPLADIRAVLVLRSGSGVSEQSCRQVSRPRMSSALMPVLKTFPWSMTLENSLAFLVFSAMTFSSIVSLETKR